MKQRKSNSNSKLFIPAFLIGIAGIIALFAVLYQPGNTDVTGSKELPVTLGHREGCFLCHDKMEGFSPSHDPEAIGCSSCHLGDPLSPDKDNAHKGLVKVPGNLDTVDKTCGTASCHKDLSHKVTGSLMATGKGVVSVNRYVFGHTDTPDGPGHLSKLGDSAADTHAKQLCVTCHLNFPKKESRPIDEKSRGGGCTACHLDYSEQAKLDMEEYHDEDKLPSVHPALNIRIGNDRCFGCHSRSARISLSYEGWHETQLKAKKMKSTEGYRVLQDKRVLEPMPADVHHEGGMLCIDCHTARDAMGDGNSYNHQEEQVEISCKDCHTDQAPKTMTYHELDTDSRKILQLRNWKNVKEKRFVETKRTGRPLLNVTLNEENKPVLISKLSGVEKELKPPAKECTQNKGHDRLTCQSCHTSWAPTCIGCHTQYHPEKKHRDHYTKERNQGAWREYRSPYLAVPPTLGIRKDTHSGKNVVDTFIPGMVMTIGGMKDGKPDKTEKSSSNQFEYQVFRRMFAPNFSHTIQSKSRSCESCHSDPRALGFGDGTLTFIHPDKDKHEGKWKFIPKYKPHVADNLPEDAWTGLFQTRVKDTATRTGSRPFSSEEQRMIMKVGECLVCHESNETNQQRIYNRFDLALKEKPQSCPQKQ